MPIKKLPDHSWRLFLKRTIAAQTHFAGCLAAFLGLLILIEKTFHLADTRHFWATLAFTIPGVLVFGSSSLYHFLADGFHLSDRLYRWLENLDHFAIYLLIAGTYTPFLIHSVTSPWQGILLWTIWTLAVSGILYTAFKEHLPSWARHRYFRTGLFLLMGWVLIVRIGEVYKNVSSTSMWLLVAGGASYTLGAVVYALKRPRLFKNSFGYHELWHVMVVLGFGFHYFMILNFYL